MNVPKFAPRVFIVHNTDFESLVENDGSIAGSYEADSEVVETANAVCDELVSAGIDATIVPLRTDVETACAYLKGQSADLVFNLVETLDGSADREHEFPQALENAKLSYTGNGPGALQLAHRKDLVRDVLGERGIRVAGGMTVDVGPLTPFDVRLLNFPLFVKPAGVDGSIGIDDGSRVADIPALNARVEGLAGAGLGPILVEEYLPGPEINVAILVDGRSGNHLVRVSATTIDFSDCPPDVPQFVTYDCKWRTESPAYLAKSVPAHGRIESHTLAECVRMALAAFTAIGGQGYGRVDLRLDSAGRPCVMEVNPNPDIHPDSGFCKAFEYEGLSYSQLVLAIAGIGD